MTTTGTSEIKTVILAGGKGTRLKPLTAVFPKPLMPLGDKPILEILLRRLGALGFKDVTICAGYLSELIVAVCGDGSQFGLDIKYSREEKPLGTAGPLLLLDDLTDPFVVMNGDLLTTLDFTRMLNFHRDKRSDVTIAVHKRDVRIDFGVVESDETMRFSGFREKPTYHFEVSMGVNIISRSVLDNFRQGEYLDMPNLILKVHENGGNVSCYREDCHWLDIGRMDDYALAQKWFAKNEGIFLGDSL